MKVYILQENYTYYIPEAGWDDNGSYDENVTKRDVIGVFPTLKDTVKKLAKVLFDAKESYKEFGTEERRPCDYDILVADTDTSEVQDVLPSEYEKILSQALKKE